MYKLKLNSTALSFLPILVLFPIAYQIIINFHVNGISLFQEFIISALNPKINNEIIFIVLKRLNETFFIAFSSWVLSIFYGIIFGILTSKIFYKILHIPTFFKVILNIFLTFLRSIHEIIWGLLLMQLFGINFVTGIIAISIPSIAINAKVFSEQLENIDEKNIESINQINGLRISTLITLIWNPIIYTLKNFGEFRLECAIRSSVILGVFGIGGIGTSIFLSFQTLNFEELWTYIWGLAFLKIITRKIFKKIKFEKSNATILIFLIVILFTFISFTFFYIQNLIFKNNLEVSQFLNILFESNSYLDFFDFFKLIFETIYLSLLSTGIAISFPPLLMLIFRNKLGLIFIKSIAFIFRLIPTPVLILALLTFNNPSISLAALTLGLYNFGITSKLLITNIQNEDKRNYIAIRSLGVSKRISWIFGLFAKQAKSYLAYCAYRSDVIIRETAIVGVLGSIGLGWQLQESLSSFAWREVIIILIGYSSIAIVGELVNGKIKASLT